jgi:basic membrane protein A
MSTLARQGYDLVIGVGFAQGDAIAAWRSVSATRTSRSSTSTRPRSRASRRTSRDSCSARSRSGYLVGYLGALEAKRAGASRSAPSAASRSRRSTATSRATGRARERPCPARRSSWGYSQDWDDQAKCKELALNQIAAGSKVVFQVAAGCGLGALSRRRTRRLGIGVDGDQSFLGPHVLTSALKGVDSAVFLTIKALEDGTFRRGENAVFGIDQEGVGLGTLSPKANKQDVARDGEGRAAARRRARSPASRRP